jgi:putative ABC transport system ATP-binding protein
MSQVVTDTGTGTGTMVPVVDVHRSSGTGDTAVHALRGVSFDVSRGELVALKGRSTRPCWTLPTGSWS